MWSFYVSTIFQDILSFNHLTQPTCVSYKSYKVVTVEPYAKHLLGFKKKGKSPVDKQK